MPEHRGNLMLAAALMRAATREMVLRGYTHVITDVFEDDPHSPLGFHTRVMGFRPVARREFPGYWLFPLTVHVLEDRRGSGGTQPG